MTENALEQALRAAARDPARLPDFLRLLLDAEVFVIGHIAKGTHGSIRMLDEGEPVSIQKWRRPDGLPLIPFFTSRDALRRAVTEDVNALGMAARGLFILTHGATLVLNPRLEHGKEFSPDEIAALLQSGAMQTLERRTVEEPGEMTPGEPQAYPSAIIDVLTSFFIRRPQVQAAYLALMNDPAQGGRPCFVVGVQAEGDIEPLFREIGSILHETAAAGEPIDLYRVVPGESELSDHLLGQVQPFYDRRWGAKLRGWSSPGHA
jgi:hypothetical protein